MSSPEIPNLDLTHIAGPRHADADLHYEALGTLASQLGRNMAMHRHDRYYQVHYVRNGAVRVQLEDRLHRLQAPMVFLTPPAFLHAFVTDDDADGHVLTVRQQLLQPMLQEEPGWLDGTAQVAPACLALDTLEGEDADEARRLDFLFEQLRVEFTGQRLGRGQSLLLLTRLVFVSLLRLSSKALDAPPPCGDELRLFQDFNALVERGFREHWMIPRYTDSLGVSEQRLGEVCRRVAGRPPKRLIHDRLMQEARRLLLYTTLPVSKIGYALGFEDPAYFNRFFLRQAGVSPGGWRARMAGQVPPIAVDEIPGQAGLRSPR